MAAASKGGAAQLVEKIEQAARTLQLNLGNERLFGQVPEAVYQIPKLQALNLYRNHFTAIPHELFQLKNLQELNFYRNQITSVPEELGELSKLRVLNLGSNRITSIPGILFTKLSTLQELDLSNNRLQELPTEIGQLYSLRELMLFRNALENLPSEIAQLKSLKKLDLHNNQLVSLPPSLGALRSLILLNVKDNPLTSPPTHVSGRGKDAILAYLRKQMNTQSSPSRSSADGKGLNTAMAGSEASFVVTTRTSAGKLCVGNDVVDVAIKCDQETMQPKVTNNKDGTFLVTYTPTKAGPSRISVTLNNTHIHGSPFQCSVTSGKTHAQSCKVRGLGISGPVALHAPTTFHIDACDKLGNLQTEQKEKFVVEIHDSSGTLLPTETHVVAPGQYEISYLPTSKNSLSVSVGLVENAALGACTPLPGSPFQVTVSSTGNDEQTIEDLKLQLSTEMKKRKEAESVKTKLNTQVQKLTKELQDIQIACTSQKEEIENLKKINGELSTSNEELQNNLTRVHAKHDKLRKEHAALRKEHKKLTGQKSESEGEDESKQSLNMHKHLTAELEEARKKIEAQSKEKTELQAAFIEMEKQLESELQARNELELMKDRYFKEAVDVRQQLASLSEMKNKLERDMKQREELVQNLVREQRSLVSGTAEAKLLEEQLKMEIEEERTTREDLKESSSSLNKESVRLEAKLKGIETTYEQLEKDSAIAPSKEALHNQFESAARRRLTVGEEGRPASLTPPAASTAAFAATKPKSKIGLKPVPTSSTDQTFRERLNFWLDINQKAHGGEEAPSITPRSGKTPRS